MQQSKDLEFTTSVDSNVQQNVPIPPQTNSVLSGMIASAEESSPIDPSQSSSYTPGSSTIPSALQFSKSSHPTACLFHILFKGLAVTIYIMGSKFGMEDVMVTVICILLLAADFWTVKNVTGRLLVGLRWWNKVDPISGATSWIFESAAPNSDGGRVSNVFDSRFFWGVLYLSPLLWGVFSISAVLFLRFNCFVTLATAMVLSCSNVYGYYKCSADQRQKVNEWMNYGAQTGMSALMRNPSLFGRLGSVFGSTAGRQQVPQQEPNTMHGTFA